MPSKLTLALAGASVAALATQPSWLSALVRWTGYGAPGGAWRIVAILLALANLKVLPGVWHLRVLGSLVYQVYLQPTRIPPHALFQPLITTSRSPLYECDYNGHKSNATYFSDFDAARGHLFTAVIRRAMQKDKENHHLALGGVSCTFKREIKPYAKYEMWTRILTWDRKWFYLVTHVVKRGVGRRGGWTLMPWRKGKDGEEVDSEELKKSIYATSIAKYVIKKGRLTVAPEQVLRDAEMMPEGENPYSLIASSAPSLASQPPAPNGDAQSNGHADIDNDLAPKPFSAENWTWDTIERERRRGLEIAQKFADLDGLHDIFDGGKDGVLGEFGGWM